jgi:hypothetical protein
VSSSRLTVHENLKLTVHPTKRFVHQYDEEYDAVKKTRRAGRPASTKEDLLRIKIAALEEEYTKGFCKLPSNVSIYNAPRCYFSGER